MQCKMLGMSLGHIGNSVSVLTIIWSWSLVSGVDSGSDTASPLLHSFPNDQQIVSHIGDKGVEPTRVSLTEAETTQNTHSFAQPILETSQIIQEKSHPHSENKELQSPQTDTGTSDKHQGQQISQERKHLDKESSRDLVQDIAEVSQSVPQNEPELGTIELRILESRNFFEENCTIKALYGKEKYIFKSKVIEGTQECLVVSVPMKEPVPRELIIEVTDAERSRHEFNGKICIDTEQLIENGRLEDIWAPLENCDAGEMLIAAEV